MSDAGTTTAPDEAAVARKEQLAADLARAKDAGWNNPVPFKYEPVVDGEAVPDETRDTTPWLSDAAIYQWDDEFGDVGEPNPELEKMLFEDPNMQRVGHQIKALSFEVSVVGPDPIKPVREVSLLLRCYVPPLMHVSSRTRVFTLSCSRTSSSPSTPPRRLSSATASPPF